MITEKFPPLTSPGYRIMICVRGQCAESDRGKKLEKHLIKLIEQHGLDDPDHPGYTTCRVTNCLGVCADGPIMIVHPGAIKYRQIDQPRLEQIFQQHILDGQLVEPFMVKENSSRSVLR